MSHLPWPILQEVERQSGLQLFNIVRRRALNEPRYTGIPQLDEHLSSCHDISDNRVQSPLESGNVIEIQGPSCSGKTTLVSSLLAKCILSPTVLTFLNGEDKILKTGDWSQTAILFDCDGRFDATRIRALLVQRIMATLQEHVPNMNDSHKNLVMGVVDDAMKRLLVFRPKSSNALATTLYSLQSNTLPQIQNRLVGVVAIDSISSFYNIDRHEIEHLKSNPSSAKAWTYSSPLHNVLIALERFRASYSPIVLLTNWALTPSSSSSPFWKQHLSPFPALWDDPKRVLTNKALYPKITHQIALIEPELQILPVDQPIKQAHVRETQRGVDRGAGELRGTVRTVNFARVTAFNAPLDDLWLSRLDMQ